MPIIDANQLECKTIGSGGAKIVFLNGFRMKYESWNEVYPKIAISHSVFLFNRHGVGSSSKAKVDQVGEVVIDEIHELLTKQKLIPPYLFVAHSLGGVFSNLYARTYPNDVSGMVFVEASHPLEIAEQRTYQPPIAIQALNEGLKTIEKIFDRFKYSEDDCIDNTIMQIKNAAVFPNIPIAIVSGLKKMPFVPEGAFAVHQRYQKQLLELSSISKHFKCHESGHFPQITEPEKVITAILTTLEQTTSS